MRGESFRFLAPVGWSVSVERGSTVARSGADFVQVATFPLARPYAVSLFDRVQPELATRVAAVARQIHGRVTSHGVVIVDGERAHWYEVEVGKRTDRYTFVLRGKREYLLLSSAGADVCRELAASFVVD